MKDKKKMKTSDIALIFVATTLALFTITMIIVFCAYQHIPDTLVVAVFGVLGTETGALAWIRTSKLKHGHNDNFVDINPTINDDEDDEETHYYRAE